MRWIAWCALGMIAVPAGAETLYVSNERGNSISVIDADAGRTIATWPVGGRPRGITLSRDGRFIYLCASADHAVQARHQARERALDPQTDGGEPAPQVEALLGLPHDVGFQDGRLWRRHARVLLGFTLFAHAAARAHGGPGLGEVR